MWQMFALSHFCSDSYAKVKGEKDYSEHQELDLQSFSPQWQGTHLLQGSLRYLKSYPGPHFLQWPPSLLPSFHVMQFLLCCICCQPQSQNITWKIPEINHTWVFRCVQENTLFALFHPGCKSLYPSVHPWPSPAVSHLCPSVADVPQCWGLRNDYLAS